jgi:hypothetical protein
MGLVRGLFAGKRLRQRQEMIAGVGERPFAFPRLGVDLPLTQIERSLLDVVLDLELAQSLAGGVVILGCGLASQFERSLPHPIGELGNVGRHAGEGGGVAVDAGA